MSEYSFLSDLLHTFQSLNDGIKLIILLIPPCFVLCAFALLLRHRATVRAIEAGLTEHERLPVRQIFDRVEYTRGTPLAIDEREELYAEPVTPILRRD